MIKIKIPNNNIQERKYILNIIFDEFLGLKYTIDVKRQKVEGDWKIELENGNKLIIEDHFFNKYLKDLEYLKLENIPSKVEFAQNEFTSEKYIPVIYGTNTLTTNHQPSSTIKCGIDIFASSFFMLTRWEEYVNKTRDKHNRFLATESLAFKNSFLDKPIVNEYVEMLKSMLLKLDDNLIFKENENKLYLTHDVDRIYLWKNWKQLLKVMIGDILKRRSFSLALQNLSEFYLIKRNRIKDPFDVFDWFMDKSESSNTKSRFYFMSGGFTIYDNKYKINEPKALELIKKIKKRGHVIGFHPSYNAYNDTQQFKQEKETLENVTEQMICEGREHYLRFEVPTTWQIWDDNGMQIDSTCGYADKVGYRCGTGNEYSVFNILTRKKLSLKERPLVLMDCSLFDYNDFSYDEAWDYMRNFKKNDTTILWHNSYIKYHSFYNQIIDLYKER